MSGEKLDKFIKKVYSKKKFKTEVRIMRDIEEVRKFFANDRFAAECGAYIEEIGDKCCGGKLAGGWQHSVIKR